MTRSVAHSGHEPGPRAIQSAHCEYRAAGVITVGYTGLSRGGRTIQRGGISIGCSTNRTSSAGFSEEPLRKFGTVSSPIGKIVRCPLSEIRRRRKDLYPSIRSDENASLG